MKSCINLLIFISERVNGGRLIFFEWGYCFARWVTDAVTLYAMGATYAVVAMFE